MDPIMQIHRSEAEMDALINAQRDAIDRQTVRNMERSAPFFLGTVGEAELAGRMNAEQTTRMEQYQSIQRECQKELDKLALQKSSAQMTIKYYELLIQMERNNMEMRLLTASVLGKETAAKRIRAKSLGNIREYRKNILDCFDGQIEKGGQTKRRNIQAAEFAKEEAAYQEAAAEHNLRVLTTAVLVEMERNRRAPENIAETMRDFLRADFSPRALEADYVIQNLADCLHNVELIRRAEEMSPAHREDMTEAAYAPVRLKLEAVREYVNVVESVLWEHGLAIDYETLQIREVTENDETIVQRRWAYLQNGALRFYHGIRRYANIGEEEELLPGGEQERPVQTRVETKLDVLESELGIQEFRGEDMRIMRAYARRVGAVDQANAGDRLRAAEEDYRGKQEHQHIKMRLLMIYNTLMQRFAQHPGKDSRAFRFLGGSISNYVMTERETFGSRRETEEREAEALLALEEALVRIHKFAGGESGRYAAILHGLLMEESSGYLEVPPGVPPNQIHSIKDESIGLGNKSKPGEARKRTYRDCKNMPLFTHRPNIKDIEQGNLGDCYLLAGLITVVDQNAEEIMHIMKDNGDGTVTVCFKHRETVGMGIHDRMVFTPYYITVEKTIPVLKGEESDAFSRGALWVKMIEKAYAASGIHLLRKRNEENAKEGRRPQTYQDFLQLIKNGAEKLDYDDISAGQSGELVSLLLGKEGHHIIRDKNRLDHLADEIGRWLPSIMEPEWIQDPARRYGNDSADSIFYEFLAKQLTIDEVNDFFVELKKPAQGDADIDVLQREYKGKKALMGQYVKSCLVHLDIVNTLAQNRKPDIRSLNRDEEIIQYYDRMKDMFRHYHQSVTAKRELSDEDKMIADVKKKYYTPEFCDYFSQITPKEFADTVDILKNRHLNLILSRQQGREVQAPGSYYTAKDRKLYEKINTALAGGEYVTFATRELSRERTGRNGESEQGGLVGTHAYAILNTRKKMIDGEERLFFVVMNPWAEKGVVYSVEEDGIEEHAVYGKKDGEREEGVFLLELKRFADVIYCWDAVRT